MAEATVFRNNALPYPIYAEQFTVTFPMLDADGDLVTGATTPDAEVSKNGDTFADCTNESTEIATNSGVYYLNLTATEMTADIVTVIAKSATAGMKTTVITLYPRKLVKVRTGTCADDGSGTADVILDSGSSAVDDYYNGMIVAVVIDGAASAECRVITDYTGSTKAATVAVGFNTAVDNTDTFIIYLPEGALHGDSLYGDKIYSDTTQIQSDVTEVDTSDIRSALTITNSQLLVVKSDTSDVLSRLTLITSEGDLSDILSRLTVTNSQVLIVKSDTSDIRSNLAGLVAAAGILSDINSGIDVIQTTVSDIQSDTNVMVPIVSDIQSDTNVLITKVTEGDWSDILSRLVVTNSQLVVVKSDVAHIESDAVRILSDTTQITVDSGAFPYIRDALVSFYGSVGGTGNDTTHVHLALLPDYGNDEINGYQLTVYNNDLANFYTVRITDFVSSSKLATIAPALPFTPDTSDFYYLLNSAPSRDVWDYELSNEGGFDGSTDAAADWLVFEGNEILNIRKSNHIAAGTIGDTGNDTTHLHLETQGHEDDQLNSHFIVFYDVSADRYYTTVITDWVNATALATVSPALPVTPQNDTDQYWILTELYNSSSGTALSSDQDSKLTRVAAAIVEVDTSDIHSLLTKVYSDTTHIDSDTTHIESDAARIDSATTVIKSQLLIVKSDTSDVRSALVIIASDTLHIESDCAADQIILSDVQSDTNALLVKVGEGDWSDILSRLVVTNSQLVVVKSDVAHIESDAVVIETVTSDIQSDTNVIITKLTEVDTSDIQSLLTKVYSDTNAAATLITKIDSDQTSQFTIAASQFVVLEQNTSDTESALVKIYSDTTVIEGTAGGLSVAQDSKLTAVHSDTTKIDTKTAGLTYTVANQVDVNIESVNGTQVDGAGTDLDPWGPV